MERSIRRTDTDRTRGFICRLRRLFPAEKRLGGSLFIDAAISIPVFVLAIAAILGIITECGRASADYERMRAQAAAVTDSCVISELPEGARTLTAFSGRRSMEYRPFIGEGDWDDVLEDAEVLVFPAYGIRYHRENCMIVTRKGADGRWEKTTKRNAEKEGYTPCLLCIEGDETAVDGPL